MAARVRDARLETPTSRAKLASRGKPYFRAIGEGLHLGYRKGKSDGKWVARVYAGSGSYVCRTLGVADDRTQSDGAKVFSFFQAQDAARGLRDSLLSRHSARGPYTVMRAMDDYISALDHAGKPTADPKYRINAHILPPLGDVEVRELSKRQIERWHKELSETPPRVRSKRDSGAIRYRPPSDDPEAPRRRRASANRTLTVLKAALNLAWRDDETPVVDDKSWRSVRPFAKSEAARIRYLSVGEAKRLVNACEAGFRNLVQAALQTGCRYSELARLLVEDFDRAAGTLQVRESKSGKSRHVILTEEGVELFAMLTAGRGGRELLLRNEARLARSKQRALRSRIHSNQSGTSNSVEITDSGEWRPSEQIRGMKYACANARLEPPVSFHALRHTWASLAVMSGAPLIVVARNLGHADTRMVEKHYGHLSPSYFAEAIRASAPRFGICPPSNIVRLA